MARPPYLGHFEGAPWREAARRALEALVESAPEDLQDAVRNEVAWEAQRFHDRAVGGLAPEERRDTLEISPGELAAMVAGKGRNGVP